jgi:hypothetical protein
MLNSMILFLGWLASKLIGALVGLLVIMSTGILCVPLKVIGEKIGMIFSPLVSQYFALPACIRWPISIAIMIISVNISAGSKLLMAFLALSLILWLAFQFYVYYKQLNVRYNSIEAFFISLFLHIYVLYHAFNISSLLFSNAIYWFCSASLLSATPAYFVRVCYSAMIAGSIQWDQRRRDKLAQYTIERMNTQFAAKKTKPFVLYLRGFSMDNNLGDGRSTPVALIPPMHSRFQERKWAIFNNEGFDHLIADLLSEDAETLIHKACGSDFLLLALGKPGDAIGAGRIATPDKDWIEIFQAVAEKADVIVVVPASSSGTIAEIKYIVERSFLSKTVFIEPNKVRSFYDSNFSSITNNYFQEWEKTRSLLAGIIDFPPHAGVDQVFFYESPNVIVSEELNWSERGVIDVLKKFIHGRSSLTPK